MERPIYGVLNADETHTDVSDNPSIAKRYATRYGYDIITVRVGHTWDRAFEKRERWWVPLRPPKKANYRRPIRGVIVYNTIWDYLPHAQEGDNFILERDAGKDFTAGLRRTISCRFSGAYRNYFKFQRFRGRTIVGLFPREYNQRIAVFSQTYRLKLPK